MGQLASFPVQSTLAFLLPMSDENQVNGMLLSEIVEGLWIGNVWSVAELGKMPSISKWTVVSLLKSPKLLSMVDTQLTVLREESIQVSHIQWSLEDRWSADFLCPQLQDVLVAMDEAMTDHGACLVHCAFGISRSSALCAAWLMTRRQMSLATALGCIRQARPEAQPNLGFVAALRALEQTGSVEAARERLMKN